MTAKRRLIFFFQKVDLNVLDSMKNTKFLTDNGAKKYEPKNKNILGDSNPQPSGSWLDAVSTMPTHLYSLVRLVECSVLYLALLTTIMTTKINSGYRIARFL